MSEESGQQEDSSTHSVPADAPPPPPRVMVIAKADGPNNNLSPLVQTTNDILNEIYWYVLQDNQVNPDTIRLKHVENSLYQEGLWFWRDGRFLESQNVALQLADNRQRSQLSGAVSAADQRATSEVHLDWASFCNVVSPCASLFLKAFSEELVIPDWSTFTTDMTYHFYSVESVREGANASYIEILQRANPEVWTLSICSIDGQRFSIGDSDHVFTIQSVSKPTTYALCLDQEGAHETEQWIGCEPSGRPFNSQDLQTDSNTPFNASCNAGAIMAAGLYASQFPEETWVEVVDKVRETWYDLCGQDSKIGFSQETFESEKATAYNNFAIAYNLKGRKGLPRNVDLLKMLDIYLGCCSIEMNTEALAVAAATFANGGVCPITSKEVFPVHVVRHVLAETMTCGMYDQAGHFAVEVGLPAKSGVSGVLMVIVPNVFGFCTFSPRLNSKGNSVRGLEFCKRVVSSYRIHLFEPLRSGNTGAKVDPRTNGWRDEKLRIARLAWALSVGDKYAMRLRDIFVLALVQGASATSEGLSERMLDLIRRNYELIFQMPLKDALLEDAASIQTPSDMRVLGVMASSTSIPDSIRNIILMALIDMVMMDRDEVEDTEKAAIVKIAVVLGIDRRVALMELNRCAQQTGHRYVSSETLVDGDQLLNRSRHGRLEGIRQQLEDHCQDMEGNRELSLRTLPASSPDRTRSKQLLKDRKLGVKRATDAADAAFGDNGKQDENILLRRQVSQLEHKIEKLTRMLNEERRRHTYQSIQRTASQGLEPGVMDSPGTLQREIIG